jgi:hypothetical protein
VRNARKRQESGTLKKDVFIAHGMWKNIPRQLGSNIVDITQIIRTIQNSKPNRQLTTKGGKRKTEISGMLIIENTEETERRKAVQKTANEWNRRADE